MRPGVHAERPSPVTRRDFMSFIEVSPQVSSRSLAFKKDHVDLETRAAVSLASKESRATWKWKPTWNQKYPFPPIHGKHL